MIDETIITTTSDVEPGVANPVPATPDSSSSTFDRVTEAEHEREEWRILVEETVGLSRENQRVAIIKAWRCGSHEEALRNGLEVAQTHQPEHPFSPRSRCVYQMGQDTWLVRVFGRTRDYHFRVIVARLVSGTDT